MMFFSQLANELFKIGTRKRTYIGFGAFLFVEIAILTLLSRPGNLAKFEKLVSQNGLDFDMYDSGLTIATFILFFTVTILAGLYLALVSGEMVAKEVEDGTMRMILNRPVTRLRILGVKIAASVLHTFMLAFFAGGTALLVALIHRGGLGDLFVFSPREGIFAVYGSGEGLRRYVVAVFLIGVSTQVISATAFMFSCFNMRPAAASILTLTVFFVDFVLRAIPFFSSMEEYFLGYHLGCWIRSFGYHTVWADYAQSILLIAGLSATCWTIGAAYFCTRDFKS